MLPSPANRMLAAPLPSLLHLVLHSVHRCVRPSGFPQWPHLKHVLEEPSNQEHGAKGGWDGGKEEEEARHEEESETSTLHCLCMIMCVRAYDGD